MVIVDSGGPYDIVRGHSGPDRIHEGVGIRTLCHQRPDPQRIAGGSSQQDLHREIPACGEGGLGTLRTYQHDPRMAFLP